MLSMDMGFYVALYYGPYTLKTGSVMSSWPVLELPTSHA